MQTHQVKPNYEAIVCPVEDDLTLQWPSQPRTHGLDVTGSGKNLIVPGGDLNGQRIQLFGKFGSVALSNLRGDFSKIQSDAIDINAIIDTLVLSNCRFTGISGIQAGKHGDGFQLQNGATVRRIIFINCTICTAYQAIMLVGDGTAGLLERATFINCNVRDEPALRKQMSVAFELQVSSKTAVVEFVNCYADWPDAGHIMAVYPGLKVEGSVIPGVPPGGDFCPA